MSRRTADCSASHPTGAQEGVNCGDPWPDLFQAAFESAAVGMMILGPDGTVLDANEAACKIVGYTEAELIGTTLRSITFPDDIAENADLAERTLAGEIPGFTLEKRYFHKDGHVVWVLLSVSLLRNEHGTPRYFLSQVQDITERKVHEDEAATAQLRMREVLERIKDGFYAIDQNWRFSYVNAAGERMLGRRRSELIGTDIWESFPEAVETPLYDLYQQVMATGQSGTLELFYPPLAAWFDVRAYAVDNGLSVFFRDITAQRQAMEELLASEETFRTLIEQLPVAVYLLNGDAAQTPRYLSPQYEQMMGYGLTEALARTEHWISRIHPDDRDWVLAEMERCEANHTAFATEYRVMRKNGEVRWVYDHCVAIRDASDAVIAWIGSMLDITDRVEGEATRARLAAIVEAAADGIMSIDRDGVILSWNHGAEQLYGYSADEAIGRNVVMLHPAEGVDDFGATVARVWQGETVIEHDAIRITREGRRITVTLTLFPVRDAQGEIVAVSSISRDVTALRETQATLVLRDRALDATRNGIVITDMTLPDNPIVDVNPAFTAMTGYTREEVLGRNCRFLQGPDSDPVEVARVREAIRSGTDITATMINYRKDGTPYWLDLSMAAVRDAQGRVTNFIGVQTDATERKNYELELQAAFEAAQAGDRAKSQFLAMMSHELRTPLQTVLGFAHLLLLDESGSLTPEQREDVLAIQQGAERMNELIQQLLDLTRFEAGKLTLASEPVDLAQLLNRVRHELAPLVAAKGLAFRVEVPPDLPEMLGDEVWLQRILLNLAGNAVKFTEDGSVTIRVAVSECEVAISVHDTGIGILPEDLPYIFDEFRQGDSSMTRRYEGAGLGLAISKRLAEQMNGTIEVESTPHVGSTFTLRLPLVCADDPQDAAHLNTAQAG